MSRFSLKYDSSQWHTSARVSGPPRSLSALTLKTLYRKVKRLRFETESHNYPLHICRLLL